MKKFTKLFLIMLLSGAALGLQAQYCPVTVDINSGDMRITNVQINTINYNSPTWVGYVNTGESTSLEQGASYNLSVSWDIGTFCSATDVRAYIDFNGDQDWYDTGEEVAAWNNQVTGNNSIMVNVPITATLGLTRLRVMNKMVVACGHDPIEPCGADGFAYHGEVEDYDITITAATGVEDHNGTSATFAIFSNANGNMQIKYYLTHSADVTLDIYNVIGQKISTLTEGEQGAGSYSYILDKTQLNNTANIYFATLRVDNTIITKKFVLR